MIGSGVGGIELMIDGFSKKGNKWTDRTTDGQTLLQGCEDASKQGCNLKTKLKLNKPEHATMRPDCVFACIDFGPRLGRTDR